MEPNSQSKDQRTARSELARYSQTAPARCFRSFDHSTKKIIYTHTEPFSDAMIMKFVSTFSGNHRTFITWLIAITSTTDCIKRIATYPALFFVSRLPMP